jgi:hypothetical protein
LPNGRPRAIAECGDGIRLPSRQKRKKIYKFVNKSLRDVLFKSNSTHLVNAESDMSLRKKILHAVPEVPEGDDDGSKKKSGLCRHDPKNLAC